MPILTSSDTALLRNDEYGKGYFGASRDGGRTHEGLDLILAVGDPVFASKSGRVTQVKDVKGYGKWVEIHHPDGLFSRYAHLSTQEVREGQWVSIHQVIGAAGKTGNAKSPKIMPHLHFEIRNNTKALDPSGGLLDPSITIR